MLYKKLSVLLLFLGLLSSCTLQRKVKGLSKYQAAVTYYEAKNYQEASRLFEEAKPLVRGKKEEIAMHFYQACCSFYRKDYLLSADRFKYFYKTFPRDLRVEEALYMRGYALYLESPDERLDQSSTQEAVQVLQVYLDQYPTGNFSDKASEYLERLNDKLALKAFNNAKLYHHLGHYQAAVVALGNFQQEFPSSSLVEKAAYLKADAQYQFSQGEQGAVQKERLHTTLSYCHDFLDYYPDSEYALAVKKIYENTLALINKASESLNP